MHDAWVGVESLELVEMRLRSALLFTVPLLHIKAAAVARLGLPVALAAQPLVAWSLALSLITATTAIIAIWTSPAVAAGRRVDFVLLRRPATLTACFGYCASDLAARAIAVAVVSTLSTAEDGLVLLATCALAMLFQSMVVTCGRSPPSNGHMACTAFRLLGPHTGALVSPLYLATDALASTATCLAAVVAAVAWHGAGGMLPPLSQLQESLAAIIHFGGREADEPERNLRIGGWDESSSGISGVGDSYDYDKSVGNSEGNDVGGGHISSWGAAREATRETVQLSRNEEVFVTRAITLLLCLSTLKLGIFVLSVWRARIGGRPACQFIDVDAVVDRRNGSTTLHHASACGSAAHVWHLLSHQRGTVDAVDPDGQTPLLLSAAAGHASLVHLLLVEGASLEHANVFGHTALLLASFHGHAATARGLLYARADVERRDHDGAGPLMLASVDGHWQVARVLLDDGGAQVEATDGAGGTALLTACANGHDKLARLLLERLAVRCVNWSRCALTWTLDDLRPATALSPC